MDIVYEDEDIIIINKLCDLVVYFGVGNLDGTVLNVLFYYYLFIVDVSCVGIVYRLDKDIIGLMVVVKIVSV